MRTTYQQKIEDLERQIAEMTVKVEELEVENARLNGKIEAYRITVRVLNEFCNEQQAKQ